MLDLDLNAGICHACLSFVSFALDDGDAREIARQLRVMTPDLWNDGLAGAGARGGTTCVRARGARC